MIRAVALSESLVLMSSKIFDVFFETPTAVFMIVYLDAINKIVERSTNFIERMQDRRAMLAHLIAEKWDLRNQIRECNGNFASLISAFYLQSAFGIVFLIGTLMENEADLVDCFLMAFNTAVYLLICLHSANKSSLLESQCFETERVVLTHFWDENPCSCSEVDLARIFRFREDWDCLRVGCFVHNSRNFWKTISTLFTAVAVVLQFDFKVVGSVADSGEYVEKLIKREH